MHKGRKCPVCGKGIGQNKRNAGISACDQHMEGARQCVRAGCGAWLRLSNKSGFCGRHTPKATQAQLRHRIDPRRTLIVYARYRAKRKGVPFSLTLDDIPVPSHCPILGTALDFSGDQSTYPSIDRIKPELGYIPGNVWVISAKANAMKWNASPEELLAFSRYWLNREVLP